MNYEAVYGTAPATPGLLIKLLGTYITNNLKWNRNKKFLVKKSLFKNGTTKTAEKFY